MVTVKQHQKVSKKGRYFFVKCYDRKPPVKSAVEITESDIHEILTGLDYRRDFLWEMGVTKEGNKASKTYKKINKFTEE